MALSPDDLPLDEQVLAVAAKLEQAARLLVYAATHSERCEVCGGLVATFSLADVAGEMHATVEQLVAILDMLTADNDGSCRLQYWLDDDPTRRMILHAGRE